MELAAVGIATAPLTGGRLVVAIGKMRAKVAAKNRATTRRVGSSWGRRTAQGDEVRRFRTFLAGNFAKSGS